MFDMQAEPWRDDAACDGADPEIFFPETPNRVMNRLLETRAKAICGSCLVAAECLASTLAVPPADDKWGIRGGLSPKERSALRKAASDRNERRKRRGSYV